MIHAINTFLLVLILVLGGWLGASQRSTERERNSTRSGPSGMSRNEVFQAKIRCGELGRLFYEAAPKKRSWVIDQHDYIYSPQLNTCLFIAEYIGTQWGVGKPWHGQLIIDLLNNSTYISNMQPTDKSKWTAENKGDDAKYQYLRGVILQDPNQEQGIKELLVSYKAKGEAHLSKKEK